MALQVSSDPLSTTDTLDLNNGSLMAGNQILAGSSPDPWYVAFDPTLDRLYVASYCSVFVLDPSTLTVEGTLTAAQGCAILYLPSTGDLYLSSPGNVTVVDPATAAVVTRIPASDAGAVEGLFVYVPRANAILVGDELGESANVVNLTLGRVTTNVTTGLYVDDGAYDPDNGNVYLNGYENDTVEMVNSSTWAVRFLPLPSDLFGFLEGVGVDTRTGNVYASSAFYCTGCGYEDLVELSGENGSVLAVHGLGAYTTGMAYDNATNLLFVAAPARDDVFAVDPDNMSVFTTVHLPTTAVPLLIEPWSPAYVPQLNTIYLPTASQGYLFALSDRTLEVYRTWGGQADPLSETWDPACGCLVVGDYLEDVLYFVNGTSYQILETVPLSGSVRGVTYDDQTDQLWVGLGFITGSGGVAILNGANGSLVTTLDTAVWANAPAFDPVDQRMFVPVVTPGQVDIYNATNLTELAEVPDTAATNAVWDSANDRVYVSDWEANNVTVLDGATGAVVTTITDVPGPDAIVVDPTTSRVYTGDQNSPEISVLDPNDDLVVGNLSFPPYAAGLLVAPSGEQLYVTSQGANLTVLNLTGTGSTTVPAGAETYAIATLPSGVVALTDLEGGVYFLASGGPYPLTTPVLSIQPSYVAINASFTISVAVAGGTGGLTYSYSGLPSGCVGADVSTLVCSASQGGQFDVGVTVNDSAGDRTSSSATLWVAWPTYVTFVEQGLPAGTAWNVTLGGVTVSSTTNTVLVGVLNGTFRYTVGTSDRQFEAAGGSFTETGVALTESVVFHLVTFAVSFLETGLPLGTPWSVVVGGTSFAASGTAVVVEEPNASYVYHVTTPDTDYTASVSSFTVAGAPLTESVVFRPVTFTVTFTETGLPSGTSWTVVIGGVAHASTGSSITLEEPNASYQFAVGAVSGFSASPSTGTFTVDGSSVDQVLAFSAASRPATLLGLPPTDFYALVGGVAAAAVGAAALLRWRRGRFRPPGSP